MKIKYKDLRVAQAFFDAENAKVQEAGAATLTYDGAEDTFEIPHSLGVVPTVLLITSESGLAEVATKSVDQDKITIVFGTAPSAGTDNVSFIVYR